MHTFYQLGKKYAFSPFFSSPFNHFFPQHDILPYLWGGGQTEKYTPLYLIHLFRSEIKRLKTELGENTQLLDQLRQAAVELTWTS